MYRRARYHVISVSVDKIAFYHAHPAWQGDVPDAIRTASALAINGAAIVTHDRDFSRVHSMRAIS